MKVYGLPKHSLWGARRVKTKQIWDDLPGPNPKEDTNDTATSTYARRSWAKTAREVSSSFEQESSDSTEVSDVSRIYQRNFRMGPVIS